MFSVENNFQLQDKLASVLSNQAYISHQDPGSNLSLNVGSFFLSQLLIYFSIKTKKPERTDREMRVLILAVKVPHIYDVHKEEGLRES